MEARSQLRHRPTRNLLFFNSRLASSPRQTQLAGFPWYLTSGEPPSPVAADDLQIRRTALDSPNPIRIRYRCQNTQATLGAPCRSRENLLFSSAFRFIVVLSSIALCQQQPGGAQPPVAYASVNELNGIFAKLQDTVQGMQTDLGRLRIDKWKTDSATKKQTLANVESIQRNLQSALPEMIASLNSSPENLSATFKLYRNLDALYDVFGSVVESAGAFGSKDEFQNLGNDMSGLETARHAFGERMQKLASTKEDELTRLRTEVKTLSAAPPPPPKKIIVDDTEPVKKPVAKKKTTTKPKTPPKSADTPPSSPPQQK